MPLLVQLSCCVFQCVPLGHGGFKEPLAPVRVIRSTPRRLSCTCGLPAGVARLSARSLSGKTPSPVQQWQNGAAWCLAVRVPGGIASCVLPEVRKQAGEVILGISRDFSVSGHWEQNLKLQLAAVRRSCNFFPAAEGWLISVQKMWALPLWSPTLSC